MIAKKIAAVFFATESNAETVRDWLKGLDKADRTRIGTDIRTVEFGWPIGMPVCKPLGRGIYEVRTSLKDRIARVLFGIEEGSCCTALSRSRKPRRKTTWNWRENV